MPRDLPLILPGSDRRPSAPLDEDAAFARVPTERRAVSTNVLHLPPDLTRTWQARADLYEDRYGEFSDYGRGLTGAGFWVMLCLFVMVTALACLLGWWGAHLVMDAMDRAAVEASARGPM